MGTRTSTNGDDRLMQYFDGELSSEEMDVVRAELEGDDDLEARRAGLEHMRDLVNETLGPDALDPGEHELDADAMFAVVEARLAEEAEDDDPMFPAPVADDGEPDASDDEDDRPPLRVVPGGKKDDVPAEVVHEEPPSRTGTWIAVAGGLAAAAAVLFFLLRPPGARDPGESDPIAEDQTPTPEHPGSEIEDVDFGYSTGSIFSVEDPEEQDTSYAVIWISDEEVEEDAPPQDDEAPEEVTPEPEDGPEPGREETAEP